MNKIRAFTKVSSPSTAAKPVAACVETHMAPAASNSLGGRAPTNKSPNHYPGQMTVGQPGATGGPPHASEAIRSDLGKLTPSLAAGVRRVSSTK